MTFATRIRATRKLHKMTQEQLALEIGISRDMISQYEVGKKTPCFATLVKIGTILGDLDHLVIGNNKKDCIRCIKIYESLKEGL